MKRRTLQQVETAPEHAIQLEYNLGDEDRAEEFEAMTPEEYADLRGIEITNQNPKTRKGAIRMARETQAGKIQRLQSELDEALDRIEELEDERQGALSALSSAYGVELLDDDDDDEESDLEDEDSEEES